MESIILSLRTSRCRVCGKRIAFVETSRGKRMPVDRYPVKFVPDVNGKNKYVLDDGTVISGAVPSREDKDIHTGWISHFASCSDPEKFRGMRNEKRKPSDAATSDGKAEA